MIELRENVLTTREYLALREKVQWKRLTEEQAAAALQNSLLVLSAYDGDSLVGMGRLVGDGAVICYVQDLIVIPCAQGRGIGSALLTGLQRYVKTLQKQDTTMMLCLMCAKGREQFYEKHGFLARPTALLGPGMIQYLKEQ